MLIVGCIISNIQDANVWDSRAEAKRAAAERMAAYQQAKLDSGLHFDNDQEASYGFDAKISSRERESKGIDPPSSSFEIALAVASKEEQRIQEAKESRCV